MTNLISFGLALGQGGSSSAPVLAYLDPGSGSMVLQMLIAGSLTGLYFLRSSLAGVRQWFGARNGR